MKNNQLHWLSIAIVVLLSAAIFLLLHNRVFDTAPYRKADGKLVIANDAKKAKVIAVYEHDRDATVTCTAEVFGYDTSSIYAYTRCDFPNGSAFATPARYAYDSHANRATDHVYKGEGDMAPNLYDLFPKPVAVAYYQKYR